MDNKERLLRILNENCPMTDFLSENRLLSGRVIDSLDFVRIVVSIESEFDISIPAEDLSSENFDSIESMYNYIQHKSGEKG